MSKDLAKTEQDLIKADRRALILQIEKEISAQEGAVFGNAFPLKHTFSSGIYVREITIPQGILLTGRIHKHDHPNFLLKGTVRVLTEDGGVETLIAPVSMISAKGTKRALYTLTEVVWTTIHLNPTNTQDIDELEEEIVVDTYEQYDEFTRKELPWYKRIIKTISMR